MASNQKAREIRVFLSSTFRDMDAERSHLIKQVFPKVRLACHARHVGFTEIDLRWGVTEEESKNGATVDICLKEIERCRDFPPFFIGILGERYGWILRHDELASDWEKRTESKYVAQIRDAIDRGISVTQLEMELAVLADGAAGDVDGQALLLLRSPTLTDTLYTIETGEFPDASAPAFYDGADGKLDLLKARIRRNPFLGLDSYTSIEQFGAAIENYLLTRLDQHFPADAVPTYLQRTRAAHTSFRYHRLQHFLPRNDVRQALLDAMAQRIESPSLSPVLLVGSSGQGKSALLADLARHIETDIPNYRVIDYYIGADQHNDLDSWVEYIFHNLHSEIHDQMGSVPEPWERSEKLAEWISVAARKSNCRYVLILDALDQLFDRGNALDVLMPSPGPDAIVVASVADCTLAREATKLWYCIEVPPLTNKQRFTIIGRTLQDYGKHLDSALVECLANADQCGSPLFLSLALEVLRLNARYANLANLVSDIVKAKDATQLFLDHFLLDEDYSRPEQLDLAVHFMALLGAARAGLSEFDLADLLALPSDPKAEDTGKARLPQIHLSRLLNCFKPFLLNNHGRLAPMHRILGEAAFPRFDEVTARYQLYDRFMSGYGLSHKSNDSRDAGEALYQITKLAQLDQTGQSGARKQLEADLGHLESLVYIDHEVVNESLAGFSYGERLALAERWRLQVEPLVEQDMVESGYLNLQVEPDIELYIRSPGGVVRRFSSSLWDQGYYPVSRVIMQSLLDIRLRVMKEIKTPRLKKEFAKCICEDIEHLGATLYAIGLDHEGEELIKKYRQELITQGENALAPFLSQLEVNVLLMGCKLEFECPPELGGRELEEWRVKLTSDAYGRYHQETIQCMSNFAEARRAQGDFSGSRALEELVLDANRRVWPEGHPNTIKAMNNLAATLYEQDDLLGARRLLQSAVEASQHLLGDGPGPLTAMVNLAEVCHAMNDYEAARGVESSILDIKIQLLGNDHADVLLAMDNLASTLEKLGRTDDAAKLHGQALEIRCRGRVSWQHIATGWSAGDNKRVLHDSGLD